MNHVYSVTEVNQYIKNMFVRNEVLNLIHMKGEVSNCKYHSSGHIYFTLKDAFGQMACVMFAGQRKGLTFRLEEGQSVIVLGNISVYERDGKYQLYANKIVLDGLGRLYEQYERLKKELEQEGLFDQSKKKPIPKYPKRIGIVTAKTGAAIQDMVNVTKRRNPYVQLVLYPAIVQGANSAVSVANGIKVLDKLKLDTIIIGRGGGSIEDLWSFNEEIVARAIFQCKTPIISAVGHETDVTIADFVADLRAPTPSAAAELAVNDYMTYQNQIWEYDRQMYRAMKQKITYNQSKIKELKMRLDYASPTYQIRQKRQRLIELEEKLTHGMKQILNEKRHTLQITAAKLDGASPLKKLRKGYALVLGENDKPVHSIKQVKEDQLLRISLLNGDIRARVDELIEVERG